MYLISLNHSGLSDRETLVGPASKKSCEVWLKKNGFVQHDGEKGKINSWGMDREKNLNLLKTPQRIPVLPGDLPRSTSRIMTAELIPLYSIKAARVQ